MQDSQINTERVHIKQCVGCGFCCKKGPCVVSIIRHQYYSEPYSCPDLKWDDSKNRYFCNALLKASDKEEKRQIKQVLSIGKGCCCGLNTDRKVIINGGKP